MSMANIYIKKTQQKQMERGEHNEMKGLAFRTCRWYLQWAAAAHQLFNTKPFSRYFFFSYLSSQLVQQCNVHIPKRKIAKESEKFESRLLKGAVHTLQLNMHSSTFQVF